MPELAVPRDRAEELLERYRRYLLAERGLRVKVARGYLNMVRPFVGARATAAMLIRAAAAGGCRCGGVPDRASPGGSAPEDSSAAGDRAAVAAAVLARGGPDQRAAGPGGAQGRQPAAGASAAAGTGAGDGAAGVVRPGDRGWAPGSGDADLLARLGLRAGRGRRAAPGRHRLAARRDHHRRQGQPPRPAPAARRCGRGDRGLAAAWPAVHGAGPQRVHPDQGAAPGPDPGRGHPGGGRGRAAGRAGHDLRAPAAAQPPPPPCSPKAGRWPRSARCCGTGGRATTAAYTKVNIEALRALARPWPGASS